MFIESIQLKNFRNYKSLDLLLDQGTNILYGDNAQGKTNILEAVYLCGTSKSHKGSKDRDMIQFQEDESHIRMVVKKADISYKIDMHLKKNKTKGIAINGIPIKKAKDLFGIVNLVFFSPEDLNIIKSGPGERRRFIDIELCQLDKIYLNDLGNYNRVLNQRNKLLHDIAFRPELINTLDVWNLQLLEYGSRVIQKRETFVQELNELIQEIHSKLSGGKETLEIVYEPSISNDKFEEQIRLNKERDIKLKMTASGPHRDDLCVKVNGIDIRKYGSQGQQRTAALSLKLSEIRLVMNKIQDSPILLLDDVLSELDSNRQNYLLDSIKDTQTFITCTGIDDFVKNQFKINKLFQVVNGRVFEPQENNIFKKDF